MKKSKVQIFMWILLGIVPTIFLIIAQAGMINEISEFYPIGDSSFDTDHTQYSLFIVNYISFYWLLPIVCGLALIMLILLPFKKWSIPLILLIGVVCFLLIYPAYPSNVVTGISCTAVDVRE